MFPDSGGKAWQRALSLLCMQFYIMNFNKGHTSDLTIAVYSYSSLPISYRRHLEKQGEPQLDTCLLNHNSDKKAAR